MFVQHMIAVLLLLASYSPNLSRIAAMTVFTHDLAPTLSEFPKMLLYLKKPFPIPEAAFGVFAVVWIVGRLIWFPMTYDYALSFSSLFFGRTPCPEVMLLSLMGISTSLR